MNLQTATNHMDNGVVLKWSDLIYHRKATANYKERINKRKKLCRFRSKAARKTTVSKNYLRLYCNTNLTEKKYIQNKN